MLGGQLKLFSLDIIIQIPLRYGEDFVVLLFQAFGISWQVNAMSLASWGVSGAGGTIQFPALLYSNKLGAVLSIIIKTT